MSVGPTLESEAVTLDALHELLLLRGRWPPRRHEHRARVSGESAAPATFDQKEVENNCSGGSFMGISSCAWRGVWCLAMAFMAVTERWLAQVRRATVGRNRSSFAGRSTAVRDRIPLTKVKLPQYTDFVKSS